MSGRRRRSPSIRWTAQHGGKIVHRTHAEALAHAIRLNWLMPRYPGERNRWPYACRWGSWHRDGETAVEHWHVGRPPLEWEKTECSA